MNATGTIRETTYQDRQDFLRLWAEYLTEQRKQGSFTHDSKRNLMNFRSYFDSYTLGNLHGFTLFWTPAESEAPQGVVMAGEDWGGMSEWDTDREKTAVLWGVYVRPEYRGKGIGLELEFAALPVGLRLGFTHVETMVRTGNEHGSDMAFGFGTKPYAALHLADLRDIQKSLDSIEQEKTP